MNIRIYMRLLAVRRAVIAHIGFLPQQGFVSASCLQVTSQGNTVCGGGWGDGARVCACAHVHMYVCMYVRMQS